MFNETIIAALTNVGPFISNAVVGSLSLGNEYSVGINMLLMETIKYLAHYLTDMISIIIIIIMIISIVIVKIGYNPFNKFECISLFKKCNTITSIAFEKCDENGIKFVCTRTFSVLNTTLIQRYDIKKTRHVDCDDFDVVIDDCNNFKLEDDLYLTVKKDSGDNKKIYLMLSSYRKNLNKMINDALKLNHADDKKYKLTLIEQTK